MKKYLQYLLIGLSVTLCAPNVYGQLGGQHIYEFLSLPSSGRVTALGGSVISIMDDDISKTYDGANPESGALLLRQGAVSKLRSRVDNVNINSVSGILDDQFHIYAATMGATDMYLYNNAFLESSNTYVASFSAEEYYLGCRYYNAAPAKFMSGEFAEVIHYNFEPGASARNKIETYLAIKYGITLSNIGGGTQEILGLYLKSLFA